MSEPEQHRDDREAETSELPGQRERDGRAIPRQIGHYHPRRVIGSGGMGVVYEAVQEQPRRTVALKIMRQGIASRSALRRFEYESQILARLRHPGIAEVYEAGMHDDGTGGVPFFAMEYIAGAKDLIAYAKEKDLGTRAKLELFLKVCDAVHHGHQKGIIHRDLKPANMLVDSSGQPKIIDFGVARATDSDLAVTTLQTSVGQLVGTVQYMSPEQIEADPHDIDTRSDVYALGMVLYELLAGRLPYQVTGTAFLEASRLIREQAPGRLGSLDRTLRGDVETIVLHALEKDRLRRYQSAFELAQDIRRYLGDRTILARPPSVVYQLRTFVRRNKILVGGIAGVFLALVLGMFGTTRGLLKARTEAAKAAAVSGFFEQAFSALEAREGAGPSALVRDLLDDAAAGAGELAGEPEVQARLRWSIGNGYKALTLYQEAEDQLRAALATQRLVLGNYHADTAQTLQDLAATLWFREKHQDAEPFFREALEAHRRIFGEENEKVARSLNDLAACLSPQKRYQEAEELYRRSLEMRRRLFGDRNALVAQSRNNLATCLWDQKRYDEAKLLLREAIETMRSLRGSEHVDVGSGLSNLARLEADMGELQTAETLYREALSIKRKALGSDHEAVAITLYHLAALLNRTGRHADAEPLCREALEIRRRRFEPTHTKVVDTTRLLDEIRAGKGAAAPAP